MIQTSSFSFTNISENDVKIALSDISASSSASFEGIHPKILKSSSEILVPVITKIFNSCLRTNTIPNSWKFALVTPLYKKGDYRY